MNKISVAALVGVAVLAAVIVEVASSSASGTPAGRVLGVAPTGPPGPLVHGGPVAPPTCDVAAGADVSASLTVSGSCRGVLTGRVACVEDDSTLYLSIRRPLEDFGDLFVTIVVRDYGGPGRYSESLAFAQVAGTDVAPRWTNRHLSVRVGRDRSLELNAADLAPEPGTPAEGHITLSGHARCGR